MRSFLLPRRKASGVISPSSSTTAAAIPASMTRRSPSARRPASPWR